MSKSEKIRQELLKRAQEGKMAIGDLRGIRKFAEAVFEDVLEEKQKKEKAQVNH